MRNAAQLNGRGPLPSQFDRAESSNRPCRNPTGIRISKVPATMRGTSARQIVVHIVPPQARLPRFCLFSGSSSGVQIGDHAVYRSILIAAFVLSAASACEAESGLASYYGGRGHHGEMTCAHRTRPFGSMVTVTHAGHSIRCRVNDRGPFVRGRVIDVSLSAARALGMMRSGTVRVSVQ